MNDQRKRKEESGKLPNPAAEMNKKECLLSEAIHAQIHGII